MSPRISSSRGVRPSDSTLAFIPDEIDRRRNLDFAHDNGFGASRELEAKPDSKARKQRGHEPAVDLHRVLDDKPAILHELERGDEYAAE
jgi:hypothetical protein